MRKSSQDNRALKATRRAKSKARRAAIKNVRAQARRSK